MTNDQYIPGSWRLLALFALAILGGGCASSSNGSAAPKPGRGIAEYREVVHEAHQSVSAMVKSLEDLSHSFTNSFVAPSARPPLARFDKALRELELTSVRTRARAEAIVARGETYFEEWKEQLSGMTNGAAAQSERQRYARMHEHFERVRQRSGEVRSEFRPFMSKLREVRARFDQPATSTTTPREETRTDLGSLTSSGRRVLQALESVSSALDDADRALHSTTASTH
jgi:hypothetical protein